MLYPNKQKSTQNRFFETEYVRSYELTFPKELNLILSPNNSLIKSNYLYLLGVTENMAMSGYYILDVTNTKQNCSQVWNASTNKLVFRMSVFIDV